MSLSLIILTYNNSKQIKALLEQGRSVSDEIIVVDSESTDNTVKIAKKFTNKVFIKKFKNNFSSLRNFAISKASGEWILSLDSDELLSDELMGEIPKLIKDKDTEGFWFSRRTYVSEDRCLKHGFFYPDWQMRLFRNKKDYRYKGAVHEQLSIPGEKTKMLGADIIHKPKNPKYTSFSDIYNLIPYMNIYKEELMKTNISSVQLITSGIMKMGSLFISGFFRGKGFLDGWSGFRAHFLFSLSIAAPYIMAGMEKSKGK